MAQSKTKLNWKLFVATRTNLVYSGLCILASVLILAFAMQPQVAGILDNRSKIAKSNDEIAKIEKKFTEIQQIKLIPEYNQSDKVDQVLPSKKPLLEIMTSLNNIANGNDVLITNFSINPGEIASDSTKLKKVVSANTSNGIYDILPLKITIYGQKANTDLFLKQVEQLSPITTIRELSINKPKTETANTQVDLTLDVHFFIQPIKATLASPLPKISDKEKTIFQTIQSFAVSDYKLPSGVEGGGSVDFFSIKKLTEEGAFNQ